ncbi:hypothetical protein HG536_0H03290 [Torulaspora globosa]|uniref:Rho-GAP domain-containing protein n=1 Tax=Torulaspora globosa TaxID=48254 RepID=A0A7G3ZN68_9SACH|nr:uncharacterized protein HG536_0H03290 [Torulaspora globosa]QLL34954.1 hypothetical protein HG536_0H03290 [Torulaspora globosa]
MKGLIWPSKNKKHSGQGSTSPSVSSSLSRSKNTSSTRSLSPSTSTLQSKRNNASGSSHGPLEKNASGNEHQEAYNNRRKSSATLSLRNHSNPSNNRSSGSVYLLDSNSKSMKSIASSGHRFEETSMFSSGSITRGSSSETDVNTNANGSEVNLNRNQSSARDDPPSTEQSNYARDQNSKQDEEKNIRSSANTAISTEYRVSLNKDNYDSIVFKSGWLNRSNHMSASISTHHLRSAGHSSHTNRESRFYHDAPEPHNNIPEYRVHRAQLKGPVLNFYKSGLPSNVKYFDPAAGGSREDATLPSTSSSSGTITEKQPEEQSCAIEYLSDQYPHPKAKLDSGGKIVAGNVESLCHTVLFAHSKGTTNDIKNQRSIINLILILPLIDYFSKFLRMFTCFGLTFTKHPSKVSNSSNQYCNISPQVDNLMTERLGLVVKTILEMFPSFLLDDETFQEVIKLLDTISLHNDEISNYLKIAVADKHNELSNITAFNRMGVSQGNSNKELENRRAKLLRDLMTVEDFLIMDLDKLAMEVHEINLKFDAVWAPRFDYSLLYDCKYINGDIVALNPLTFNNQKNVHFLGRLLTCHLLSNDRKANRNAKLGAKILTKWVEFGGKFEALGDMVSWLAVATIVCSIPILRLKSLWTHVPENILRTIFKDWIPTIAQLDRRHLSSKSTTSVFILAPPNLDNPFIKSNVISYFGDLMIHADDLPSDTKFKYLERKVNRTKNAFFKWQERLQKIKPGSGEVNSKTKDFNPDESNICQFWRYHLSQTCLNIDDIMKLSLAYEPPQIDQESYSNVGVQRSPLSSGSFLPILFNEVCPSYSLFPQDSLIGAAGASDSQDPSNDRSGPSESSFNSAGQFSTDCLSSSSPNNSNRIVWAEKHITGLEQIDAPLMKELSSKQSNRQHMLKCIRDAFNVDSDIFHVADDLIFKSLNDFDVNSRPSSVVIETPKRFSQQSLNNGNHVSQRDIEDTPSRLSRTLENMDFFSNIGKVSETLKESVIEVVLKSGSLERLYDLLVLTASVFSKLIDTKDLEKYYQHKRHRSQLGANRSSFMEADSIGLLDYAFVKLTMDMDVYTETFFNSYKSFATTTSVIENLARRYVGAKSCAFSISQCLNATSGSKVQQFENIQNGKKFPVWDTKVGNDDSVSALIWVKIQVGAAEALLNLVEHHYADFTDDMKSNATLLDFLKVMEQDVTSEWPKRIRKVKESDHVDELSEIESLVSSLHDLFNAVRSCYQKQLYRPLGIDRTFRKVTGLLNSFHKMSLTDYNKYLSSNDFDDPMITSFRQLKFDQYESIINWIYSMDYFIFKKFQFATKQDWFATFQKLEATSCESLTSLYCLPLHSVSYNLITSGSARLDDLEVSNVFAWISNLDGNPADGTQPVLNKLPEAIQLLIKLHMSLTVFFMIEVTDLEKSVEDRINTCAVVLQILKYVRWKNSSLDLFKADGEGSVSPHIPSFIETAIINATVSPESRYYEHAWSSAYELLSSSRHRSPGKISTLLIEINDENIKSFSDFDEAHMLKPKNLCPCPGWIVQRLLEISQFVPNMSIMNSKLINFDKRRFVNNFVSNILDLTASLEEDITSHGNIPFSISLFQSFIDPAKAFKRSARNLAMAEGKLLKYQEKGLFNEILAQEIDKTKRDHKKIEILSAQERDIKRSAILQQMIQRKQRSSVIIPSLQRNDVASPPLSKIPSSAASSSLSNTSRDKRSSAASYGSRNSVISTSGHNHMGKKIGGFFKRPFSIGGFNSSASSSSLSSILIPGIQDDGSVSPDNLPALDPSTMQDQKPVFSIKTFEIKSIIEVVNHQRDPAHLSSFKILMHDGHEHMFQAPNRRDLVEWIEMIKASKRYAFHSKKYRGQTHNKLFGVPLEDVCEREGTNIPTIIVKLLEEIEIRGLEEVGLYRIPGSVGSVNALKNAFDQEGAVGNSFTLEDDRWFEINAIAGCFKMYLRELPDCLFSNERIDDFVQLAFQLKTSEITEEAYRTRMIALLQELPSCYYHTLKLIFFHLNKVHQHMHKNRMDASNLAIVFSMSFINQDDLTNSMGSTLGAVQSILQCFIKSPGDYFSV